MISGRVYLIPIALVIVLALSLAAGPLPQEAKNLVGKMVYLRVPFRSNKLVVRTDGTLQSNGDPGTFPADSALGIEKIKQKSDGFEIQAQRATVFFDKSGARQAVLDRRELHIILEAHSGKEFEDLAAKLLSGSYERSADISIPTCSQIKAYQADTSMGGALLTVAKLPNGEPIYGIRPGDPRLIPPKVVYSPDPQYPPGYAHEAIEGSAVASVLVGSDGNVDAIRLEDSKAIKFGLEVADAVSRWRFQPATSDGKAVLTVVCVETNFHLY